MSLKHSLYLDYRRYRAEGAKNWRDVIFFNQGFWATCFYRMSRHFLERVRLRPLRSAIGFFFAVVRTLTENITGIALPPEVEIGEGLCIFHFGPTVLNHGVSIGRNCNLRHGVTIGSAGRGDKKGAPTIGDRVDIGANAIVIGKITIGNDAAIGAGAVVTKSVPNRGVVAGNPARLLSYRGSFDFVHYDGRDTDPERLASLEESGAEKEVSR